MLYISRKIGQEIIIGNNIKITIVSIQGKTAKIGIECDNNIQVLRKEIFDEIFDENTSASSATL